MNSLRLLNEIAYQLQTIHSMVLLMHILFDINRFIKTRWDVWYTDNTSKIQVSQAEFLVLFNEGSSFSHISRECHILNHGLWYSPLQVYETFELSDFSRNDSPGCSRW